MILCVCQSMFSGFACINVAKNTIIFHPFCVFEIIVQVIIQHNTLEVSLCLWIVLLKEEVDACVHANAF